MQCPQCETGNPAGARFCMSCGHSLEVACPNCDTALPTEARFCFNCGHEIEAGATAGMEGQTTQSVTDELADDLRALGSPTGERRTITMMFCDVIGSTKAAEQLDPEDWTEVMRGAFDRFIEPVERFEGSVARLLGDAILAYFGAPVAHEDDPQRAILSALAILDATDGYGAEVRARFGIDFHVRIGINTGLVVVGEVGSDMYGEYAALGDAANIAARMEQTADPDTIRIAPATHRLVAPLFDLEEVGAVEVKGKSEPLQAYRVIGTKAEPGRLRGIEGLHSPVVGRDLELEMLQDALYGLQQGRGQIVSLIGEAGLGKTRLSEEIKAIAIENEDLSWVEGQSYSYDTTTPFAPFIDLLAGCIGLERSDDNETRYGKTLGRVKDVLGADAHSEAVFIARMLGIDLPDEDVERIKHLLPPQIREGTFGAARSYLGAMASSRPVVVVLEDLHWADPASIDLLETLLPLADAAQLMLLLQFRPRRAEPSWRIHEAAGRGFPHRYTAVHLRPLQDEASRELVAHLLAVEGLRPSVREAILDKAEGNPFFVEEVVRSLLDAGIIVKEGERFVATTDVEEIAVPDSLAAVIATRLDGLEPAAKKLVQTASVIGRDFSHEMIGLLTPEDVDLDGVLADLLRRELVLEKQRRPDQMFTFKHALTMDTAYESLLVSVRKDLHRIVGKLIEERDPDQVTDLARHFLAADETSKALPYLVASGDLAYHAYSMPDAERAYRTALALWEEGDEIVLKRRAFEGLAGTVTFMGDFEGAFDTFDEMLNFGKSADDIPTQVSALNKRAFVSAIMLGDLEEAESRLLEARRLAEQGEDLAGLAEFHVNYCSINTVQGRLEVAAEHLQDATVLGAEIDSSFHRVFGMTHYASTLIYMTRFEEAERAAQEALDAAEAEGERAFVAEINGSLLSMLELAAGRPESGFKHGMAGIEIAEEIGALNVIAYAGMLTGGIGYALGRYEEAAGLLERAHGVGTSMGHAGPVGMSLGLLASIQRVIHGPSHDVAVMMAEAREHLLQPLGAAPGPLSLAWMAHVAAADGDLEFARTCLEDAFEMESPVKHLARPDLLLCSGRLAMIAGNIEEAAMRFGEAAAFADGHQMRWVQPRARAAVALADLLAGDAHPAEAAITAAARDAAGMNLLPDVQTIHREVAMVYEQIGRADRAQHHRGLAMEATAEIASMFDDADLRRAYLRTNAT